MPYDPTIALKVAQPQFDVGTAMQNALALRNAQQTGQLNQMKLAAEQQAAQETAGLQNYLAQNPDLSSEEAQNRLVSQYGQKGIDILNTRQELANRRRQGQIYQQEYDENHHKEVNRAVSDIAKYANKADALADIERNYEEGKLDDAAYNSVKSMVQSEPVWARSQSKILQSLLSEKERLETIAPAPEKVDVGGSIKIIDMNPNSPTYMKEIKSLTKSATPGQELTNERLSKSGVNAASYPLVAQAIADGLLSPDRVNSRNVSILENAARVAQEKGQSLDFNQLAGQGALARNPAFQQKAMAVESIPEVISKVAEAGKKLNFSDNLKAVADIQKWYAGQIQDPKLTEYMTLRNDSLMSIAYAMRQAGMSDYATRMEAEAASPSMSPKQLDAWVSAQMKALEPRLKQYRSVSVTGSKTSTPPAAGGGAQTPTKSLDDIFKKKTP